MLRQILPLHLIAGLIVPLPNYYNIADSTMESFILDVYNTHLKKTTRRNSSVKADDHLDGFLKVFSQNPRQFHGSYSKLLNSMQCLKVKKLFLWPRFRDEIQKSIVKGPEVIELMGNMPQNMRQIHDAILSVMQMCIDELVRENKSIDLSDLTIENTLFKSFHRYIRSQIDPIYHKIGKKFKQLIKDLDLLRRMANNLMQYDCVTFYEWLQDIKRNEISEDSIFVLLNEAHVIFDLALSRLYTSEKSGEAVKYKLILEEHPKLQLLDESLEEIYGLIGKMRSENENIMILVRDKHTVNLVTSYISCDNKDAYTLGLFKNHIMRQTNDRCSRNNFKRVSPTKSGTHLVPNVSLMNLVAEYETSLSVNNVYIPQSDENNFDKYFGIIKAAPSETNFKIIVHEIKETWKALSDYSPKFIILFDPTISVIREIEVYKASHPGTPIRVYFLMINSSIEENKYKFAISNELRVFESLIKEKASLVFPSESVHNETISLKNKIATKDVVIVDVREFRSKLPVILHLNNVDVVPQTLLIADYILTPDIAVERKSVADLIQSFTSGRLYNQMEQMCRSFRTPVLLIEFDETQPFGFYSIDQITTDINQNAISSKLVLMSKSFPKMRIVWTRSPYETANIFLELKKGKFQPDQKLYESSTESEVAESNENVYESVDILKKMPGIHDNNLSSVLDKGRRQCVSHQFSLATLASMSKTELENVMGLPDCKKMLDFLQTPLHSNKQ